MLKKDLSRFEKFLSIPPPEVSFEFFPPRTPEMEGILWSTIRKLESLNPAFVSVTYGAGGSTRELTHQTVTRIQKETSLTAAAHLTCIGDTRSQIDNIAQNYWNAGVKHIVALRGDPPEGVDCYAPHPDGYNWCCDLVKGLKNTADFEISVAAFPEGHPETGNIDKDLDFLKMKIDAGATRAITQYFFDTDIYFAFLEQVEKAGIKIPIVPGILLQSNFKQMVKFNKKCGATIPKWIYNLFEGLDNAPNRRLIVSAMIASEQCRILRESGVEHFHFYTLNHPIITIAVCHTLGIRPKLPV